MTLEIITSPLLEKTKHGFFTRKGGASSGIFASLNCGLGSSDQTDIVKANRVRVAAAMGVPISHLQHLYQVHSADAISITEPLPEAPKADALVTNTRGIALSVLTADCAPVLFTDPENGVIGAAHSGWKGALGGIVEATLEKMEALGAKRGSIHAVIGPCISQRAYEVGQEFLESFLDEDPRFSQFFINGENGKYLFDLPGLVLEKLRSSGINHAEWTGHCTYFDESRFFSYRRKTHRNEMDYGRQISTIVLA